MKIGQANQNIFLVNSQTLGGGAAAAAAAGAAPPAAGAAAAATPPERDSEVLCK